MTETYSDKQVAVLAAAQLGDSMNFIKNSEAIFQWLESSGRPNEEPASTDAEPVRGVYFDFHDYRFTYKDTRTDMISAHVGTAEVQKLRDLLDIPDDRLYSVWEIVEIAGDLLVALSKKGN